MSKDTKDLKAIHKRIDDLEKEISSKKFIKKIVDSLDDIVLCDNCGIVVMARSGSVSWSRKEFFQVGKIKNRIASWCSDECERNYNKEITDNEKV